MVVSSWSLVVGKNQEPEGDPLIMSPGRQGPLRPRDETILRILSAASVGLKEQYTRRERLVSPPMAESYLGNKRVADPKVSHPGYLFPGFSVGPQ